MVHTCGVCKQPIEPNAEGRVRVEGVTEAPRGKAWVWGPVTVHDGCRLRLVTPHDDRIGDGYILTSEWLTS